MEDNSNSLIKFSDDDMFLVQNHRKFSQPFRYADLINLLKKRFSDFSVNSENLCSTGIKCKLMKTGDSTYQEGKLKVTVEFIPDAIKILPQVNVSELKNDASLLDWLRQ